MMLRVQLLQPFARDVGIDRRRRDIGMPEQQLHDAHVGVERINVLSERRCPVPPAVKG